MPEDENEAPAMPDKSPELEQTSGDGGGVGAVVEKWFQDHFHGPNHMQRLGDAFAYTRNAVDDLKRRLKEEK